MELDPDTFERLADQRVFNFAVGPFEFNTALEVRWRRRWAVVCALAFFGAYLFMNERQTVFLYDQF